MGTIKPFKQVAGVPTEEIVDLQKRLQEFFVPIVNNPLLDGVLLTNVAVNTSPTKVEHKLRRDIQGWIVVRNNTNCTIWEPSRDLPGAFLTLQSSSATTIDLWVF